MKIASKKQIEYLVVIHYTDRELKYDPEKMGEIINSCQKPEGKSGLWTSPTNSEWGWKDWCSSEGFRDNHEEKSFKLKFNLDSKILLIDSYKDLDELPVYTPDWAVGRNLKFCDYPDFEKLSKEYDAIWLTEKGNNKLHLSLPKSLNSWDVETVFIMNPNCCYQIK